MPVMQRVKDLVASSQKPFFFYFYNQILHFLFYVLIVLNSKAVSGQIVGSEYFYISGAVIVT